MAAVYVLFMLNRGMDFLQISILNIIFVIFVFLFEIPTGAFADTLGRKTSFVISCFITSIAMFIYFLSRTFWSFVLAEIILAIGITFYSGAFQAWLVDSLKHYKFKGSFDKVFSKEQQVMYAAATISGLSGAYVAKINLGLPLLLSAISLFLVGVLAQILMNENYFKKKKFRVGEMIKRIKDVAVASINYGIKNKIVFTIICLGIVGVFAAQAPGMYWQPRFNEFLPNVSSMGWILTAIGIAGIIGNKLSVLLLRLVKKEKLGLMISQLLKGLFLCLAALSPFLIPILIFFIVYNIGGGLFGPIKSVYLNKNIPSEKRATIISFDSMALKLGSGAGLLVSGILAKSISIPFSWLFSGIFLISGTMVIYLCSKKIN